mmetsp:Transcript_3763/g.8603  ORF Transcript_3763/g.8603 Transcript_3763/m.8603 type:complete len:590 (+) Transcript_3763:454-2223(+)|eukprot:CAMPEP_0201116618 /NCGR_PEP_ID=MMETSP0850-20130426/826_1 /ASSEMBLY_ACC=CAM_ASM_000622 /TAXON_ID=183588 /ORGANISM="Pseudo-nitzschia fraudulenta, Strain WWA7" /LENGTH=589 /DNA_ID=CAMNT_0047380729 /DNA_START=367 /DNA_END=2136 /DNA_ORIENTATION=-
MGDSEFAREFHSSGNENKSSNDDSLDPAAHYNPSSKSQLLTVSFNQDGGCLAVGTANGFSVHNLRHEYNVSVERTLRGGIGLVEMLFRCNIMAIVGGGSDPHAAPHRVLIWDDHLAKEKGELSFRQAVLRVKLRKDAIAVALRDRVYVYNFADLSLRDKIYTADNPFGLLSLNTRMQGMVLACPSVTTGHVRVELYGMRKTMLIEAHESTLRALVLTTDGGKLATASHKGTIVRVFDVATSQNIYEFRRGVERANITCLAFSCDDQWISCSSDKGTTHIFYLEDDSNNNTKDNNNRKNGGSSSINSSSSANSSSKSKSTGYSLFSSGSRMLMNSFSPSAAKTQPKSVCQIRGVPHPLACSFIRDAPSMIAVAGWDADGNGVLLISEFAAHQEARRVGYHVLVRNSSTADESEEERRRRRARGWVPGDGSGTNNTGSDLSKDDPRMHFGHLRISDEMGEQNQRFTTQTTEDFCEIIAAPPTETVIKDKSSVVPSSENENKNKTENDGGGSDKFFEAIDATEEKKSDAMDPQTEDAGKTTEKTVEVDADESMEEIDTSDETNPKSDQKDPPGEINKTDKTTNTANEGDGSD